MMQSAVIKAVCQIGIFMICAQAIVHFRPKESYEKYLKMLVSSMVLIQLFLAVGSIFSADGMERLTERMKWFTESMNESMREASDNAFFSRGDLQFRLTGEKPESEEKVVKQGEETQEIRVQIAPVEVEVMTGIE